MGMSGDTALVLAKNYVKKTLQGQGALKGQDGFSPIIEENADNTDKVYKLDITTADSAFTTPNLRGKDGESSGGGEANVIESISVNGTPISVDENKNVDITVPSIDGLAKTEDIPTKVSELTNDSNYQTAEQVNSAVTTEIAKVVADAPEDLNTLKEMSDWIAGHENDASAMNSAISDNKTAITALQTGKADKSEIPTTLPADGGNADTVNNHTVETDVPVDAKFTDTIYDDTKIKYGEIAGGKNLFNGNFIEDVLEAGKNYTDVKLIKEQNTIKNIEGITFAVFGAYLKKGTYTFSYTNDAYFSLNRIAIAGTDCALAIESIRKSYTWTQNADGWTYFGIEGDDSETGVTDTPFSITPDIQIEKGTQATEYEPYIPSVKMIAEEVSAQNESLSVIGKCKNLLNPTLQTTTLNGVTCTNNGDGTYTLNGTVDSEKYPEFPLGMITLDKGKYLFPNQNSSAFLWCGTSKASHNIVNSQLLSNIFINIENKNDIYITLVCRSGETYDNVVIKPMITTDLSTTYDDFVPYTGDGDTLTHDVADLKNNLAPKKIELQNVDERVTIQDNGSFIINGFAFVNLLVTFNETLPQWSNFVRLPRPKGGNVSVYCENSVRFTIYSQDNLPGDCGTYETVASGTEIRLLVNYEVA